MSSLKEIATHLGVSEVLVSRVLSNRMGTTRASEKTRQAILNYAKKVDYVPNALAVALQRGRKGAVGVFVHGIGAVGSELSLNFIETAAKILNGQGLNLWLQFFGSDDEFYRACNSKLLRKIDGLIVAGISHDNLLENLRKAEAGGLPVAAACHGSFAEADIVNFTVDHEMQSYLTTKHLLEVGCRRIAHFRISPVRHEGYLRAHREKNIPVVGDLCVGVDGYGSKDGAEGIQRLHNSGVAFDGISAQSDAQATGALHYLVNNKVDPAEWPKITGIDNSPIARDYSPLPLTSATSEMETCARLAVEAILLKMEGHKAAAQVVPPHLVIRESTVL